MDDGGRYPHLSRRSRSDGNPRARLQIGGVIMEAVVSMFSAMGGDAVLLETGAAVVGDVAGTVVASPGFIAAGDVISGTFTAASALATIKSANMSAAARESSALFEEFNAKQDLLEGRREGIVLKEELNAVLARNRVAGPASGLRGSGNVTQASLDAIKEGDFQLDLTRQGAIIRAGGRSAQARADTREAGAMRVAGMADAAGLVVSAMGRSSRRGKV